MVGYSSYRICNQDLQCNVMKPCLMWALLGCSCSRGCAGLHRAESQACFDPQLSRSWSRIWPTECHPWSPSGAADPLGSDQNQDERGAVYQDERGAVYRASAGQLFTRGLTSSQQGQVLCHLEGPELPGPLLLLLEAATLSPSSPTTLKTHHCFHWQFIRVLAENT